MNCSTPGLPVHHQLPEFTQTHVHRVSDVIQPSHPLSSPSPPAPNPSQHHSTAILMCWWIKIVVSWKWKSHQTLCNPMANTVHGILQARILEWVAFPFSRGSSQTRDETRISYIAGGFFTNWAIREALYVSKPEKRREEGKKRKRKELKLLPKHILFILSVCFLLFSGSVLSGSLWPQGLQHARLPCPPPFPGRCSNSCSLSRWCHLFTTPLQLRNWFWTCFMVT